MSAWWRHGSGTAEFRIVGVNEEGSGVLISVLLLQSIPTLVCRQSPDQWFALYRNSKTEIRTPDPGCHLPPIHGGRHRSIPNCRSESWSQSKASFRECFTATPSACAGIGSAARNPLAPTPMALGLNNPKHGACCGRSPDRATPPDRRSPRTVKLGSVKSEWR